MRRMHGPPSRPLSPARNGEMGTDKPVTWVLASCPFCLSEVVECSPLQLPTVINGHQACCGSCGACGPEEPNMELAVAAWNRRAPSPSEARLAEAVEVLKRIEAVKYPAIETIYAHRVMIDYARDQARSFLNTLGGKDG